MTEKQLIITFDYELFLGSESGSVSRCQIIPTEELRQTLNRYGLKGIFFVDTTHLLRLRELKNDHPKVQEDWDMIGNQLAQLVEEGHYVYPHLHPHWLDAEYNPEANQWKLTNYQKYRFAKISDEERAYVFDQSVEVLKEMIPHADYRIEGYRAGGWCIQPFSDFLPFFQKHGIYGEFSVLKGRIAHTTTVDFDFSQVKENIYPFSEDVCTRDENGDFVELTISSVHIDATTRWKSKWLNRLLWRTKVGRSMGRGVGAVQKVLKDVPNPEYADKEMVSIELLNLYKLPLYRRFLSQNDYMHFISHPKMISKHNLAVFNRFLKEASEKYKLESDWKKISAKAVVNL